MFLLSRTLTSLMLLTVLLAGSFTVSAQQVTHERIPTPFIENGQPVTLEVVIFRPPGVGPFPTLVFLHGSTGQGNNPALFSYTYAPENLSRYFNDRGWMVVYPQRRGRGKSGGLYDEGFNAQRSRYSCEPPV